MGQRWRIIYKIEEDKALVFALGIRKKGSRGDIYQLAKKLIKLKFME